MMLVGVGVGSIFTDLVPTDTATGSITIHKGFTRHADPPFLDLSRIYASPVAHLGRVIRGVA